MDYNATTPLAPEVIRATYEAMRDAWGNPSSSYVAGEATFAETVILRSLKTSFKIFQLQTALQIYSQQIKSILISKWKSSFS